MRTAKGQHRGLPVAGLIALLLAAFDADADWLVTQEGQRIETRGEWEVRGRMVVFTLPNGTLSSIRLDEVDLEASRTATAEASLEPEPPPEEAPRESVLSITDRDIGRAEDAATGPDALVERLREAHRYQDVASARRLFNWQDTPEAFQGFMDRELEWLMGRRISNLELSEIEAESNLEQVHDGITYEPNVDVTHRLQIELVPDADDERLTLTLYVGTRLGSYYVAAARPAAD